MIIFSIYKFEVIGFVKNIFNKKYNIIYIKHIIILNKQN